MARKKLFMETTKIASTQSAADVTSMLVEAGSRQILTEYASNGQAIGLHFRLDVNGADVPFNLPVRVDPIFDVINGRRKTPNMRRDYEKNDRAQAVRVAWRQIYRWVESQLALIDTGMVTPAEVFMPYVEVGPGITMYQRAVESGSLKQLASTNP